MTVPQGQGKQSMELDHGTTMAPMAQPWHHLYMAKIDMIKLYQTEMLQKLNKQLQKSAQDRSFDIFWLLKNPTSKDNRCAQPWVSSDAPDPLETSAPMALDRWSMGKPSKSMGEKCDRHVIISDLILTWWYSILGWFWFYVIGDISDIVYIKIYTFRKSKMAGKLPKKLAIEQWEQHLCHGNFLPASHSLIARG